MSPYEGEAFSLFLPWVNTEMMNLYLEELSQAYPDNEMPIIRDPAGWHGSRDPSFRPISAAKPCPPIRPNSTLPNASGNGCAATSRATDPSTTRRFSWTTSPQPCKTWPRLVSAPSAGAAIVIVKREIEIS